MCALFKDLLDPVCYPLSLQRLKKLEKQLKTPATRLALPFIYRGAGHYRKIAPMQAHEEIAALYQRVRELQPQMVVEIGTCHGGSLYLWCQAAAENATIVSLDLPGGEYGGGYHTAREKLYMNFAQHRQTLHLLRGNSHEEASKKRVNEILKGKGIDFLFIDGDHSYEGVKKDYEMYRPLVRKGGMVALHDTAPRNDSAKIEVSRFWNEVKAKEERTEEFLNTHANDRTIGIGVVHC